MREGVIQFSLQHHEAKLRPGEVARADSLLGWRSILRDTGLLGADDSRYEGLGFGNISARVSARGLPRGARPFVVSGTQTADRQTVSAAEFACVDSWSVATNTVVSRGLVQPSSESLTHATIYDYGPHLAAVLHVHSPDIFAAHRRLNLPTTPADVDYGTVAMADATAALFRAGRVLETQCFVMLGHDDGIVAFGRDPDDAGAVLLRLLAAART